MVDNQTQTLRDKNNYMKIFIPVLCVLLLFISACSDETTRLSPLSNNAVILAFGDSLTHGSGAK